MSLSRISSVLVVALTGCLVAGCKPQVSVHATRSAVFSDVLTQHGNPQRTGAALGEKILTPEVVQSGRFGRLFDWEIDGQIYTQPLYVSGVRDQAGGRTLNLVLVATTNNSVYAFEAPSSASGIQPSPKPLWQVGSDVLGQSLPYNYFFMPTGLLGFNIYPRIGIVSTPVVDRTLQSLYLTVKHAADPTHSSDAAYDLVRLDLLTGKLLARQAINASYQNVKGITRTLDAKHHLQRPSLLEVESTQRLYIAFGSHQDTDPYHGWVLAYDAKTLQLQGHVFCSSCDGDEQRDCTVACAGIWQAGGGLAADDAGNVYVITGNGAFNHAGKDRGSSFIKFDRNLNVLGSWTPATYDCLNRTDSDLGSAGPAFVLNESLLIGGGKEGVLYALRPEALQGTQVGIADTTNGGKAPCEHRPTPKSSGPGYWSIQAAPLWQDSAIMQILRFFEPTVASQGYHHIHGSPAVWLAAGPAGEQHLLFYVSAERDLLRAFEFKDGFVSGAEPGQPPVDTFHSRCANSGHGMPGGFLTVSADGNSSGSGIVWALMPRYNKDALDHIAPGVLRAYRAYPDIGRNVLAEIWNSDDGTKIPADCGRTSGAGRDAIGRFAKFVPPTVADGKIYVSTFSGRLAVYGLRQAAGRTALATAEDRGFNAQLELAGVPETGVSGSDIIVTIKATNTGSAPWHAADAIRLGSLLVLSAEYASADRTHALDLDQDVPPGQSYTFRFSLKAPADEAVHYYSWRLRLTHGSQQPSGDWFGNPTSEWKLITLRPDCNPVRDAARSVVSKIKAAHIRPGITDATVDQVAGQLATAAMGVRKQADELQCPLDSEIIDPEGH